MKRKTLVRWLSLFLLIAAVIGVTVVNAAPSDDFVLEDMVILIPANPTDVEKSAASELKTYLQKITGSSPSVYMETEGYPSAIYLGNTEFARKNNVTYTDNNDRGEGWAIKAVGDNLVLTGGEVRGTLYAVWHLLEDELGVHWWNMWEEYVPQMQDAKVSKSIDRMEEPAFAYRDIYLNAETTTHLFFARNRANGFVCNAPQSYGGEENWGLPAHDHVFNMYFPAYYQSPSHSGSAAFIDATNPDKVDYYVEHPEWFAWSNARQARVSYGQLCLTNEGLFEAFVEKMLKAIEVSYARCDASGTARPRYMNIGPNDTPYHCECETCWPMRQERGESGYVLTFANRVAEEIEKYYPEITIETSAYWQYLEAPKDDTKPRHNVLIRMCDSEMDIVQSIYHPFNADVERRMKDWAAICNEDMLIGWIYGTIYSEYGVLPTMFRYQELMQFMLDNSYSGYFMEMQGCNNVDFWDMKIWVANKLMEDPYQDFEALCKTFLAGYYGEGAADPIYDFLAYTYACVEAFDTPINLNDEILKAEYLTAEDILVCYDYFAEAEEALKNDSSFTEEERELRLNRLHAAMGGLDRVTLRNYSQYVNEMAANGDVNSRFDIPRREVGSRMVNSLKWLSKMEVTPDHTGYNQVSVRDRYDSVESRLTMYGQYLEYEDPSLGNKVERPDLPEQVLLDHPDTASVHIHDYTGDQFWIADKFYSCVSKEMYKASYPGGVAAIMDTKIAMEKAETEGLGEKSYFTVSESQALTTNIGKFYLDDPIIADGEYHLYHVKDTVLVREDRDYVTFFAETIRVDCFEDLKHLKDKRVDLYFSMKIEGDPSMTDPDNYPKYYLDRFIIVEPCNVYDMDMTPGKEATCSNNATEKGICPACGKLAECEIPGTKLPHDITGGYTYHADQKCYTANCANCGEVTYDVLGEYPEEIMDVANSSKDGLSRILEYGVGRFSLTSGGNYAAYKVNDPDSQIGQAARWEYATLPAFKEYFEFSDTQAMNISGCGGISTKIYGSDMIVDGKYHTYHLKGVPLVGDFECIMNFFDWSMRVDFSDLEHLYGKTVDVYFTMKIDGELNYTDPAKYPTYYIDRLFVVEPCNDHTPGTDYVYNNDAKQYEAECKTCGGLITITNLRAELPEELMNEILDSGIGFQHVYDYNVDNFSLALDVKRQEDPESVFGAAAVLDANKASVYSYTDYLVTNNKPMVFYGYKNGAVYELGQITYKQMSGNVGKGYQLYKFEDVVLVQNDFVMLYAWEWGLQNHYMAADLAKVQDKPVDLYISLKAEGPIDNNAATGDRPIYYLDRMIVVDNCANHISKNDLTLVAGPTCTTGSIMEGDCPFCGKTSRVEMEDKLGHVTGSEYIWNAAEGYYEATCSREGCSGYAVYENVLGQLPDEVVNDLVAEGMGMEHVYDYDVDDFILTDLITTEEDPDSLLGRAAVLNAWDDGNPGWHIVYPDGSMTINRCTFYGDSDGAIGSFSYDELNANPGEYNIYKLDDVVLYDGSFDCLWMFYWNLQCKEMRSLSPLKGKAVDYYLSMKIVGDTANDSDPTAGPVYYVDRMIVVDKCSNHITEDDYVADGEGNCATGVTTSAKCPVCGKVYKGQGSGDFSHSFTKYTRVIKPAEKTDDYISYCDYGCGATDMMKKPTYSYEEILPEALPESARNHIIRSYDAHDINMSTQLEAYIMDFELGRPVTVRDYAAQSTTVGQMALNMNDSGGINLSLYGSYGTNDFGFIKADEIIENANKGWHLYEVRGCVPIIYPGYELFFMFGDWVAQSRELDDDLIRDYPGKKIDFYVHMKVTGDPTCQGDELPVYYVDQIIMAESCTVDETWTINKPATCAEEGSATGNCSVCGGKNITTVLPKISHVIENGVVYQAATCRTEEQVKGKCSVCGQVGQTMYVPGSKLEHSFTKYNKDDYGNVYAFCDHGCGTRNFKDESSNGKPQLAPSTPENKPQLGSVSTADRFYFRDVSSSDWFFDDIKDAVERDLINGVTVDEFRPNETLTTAQAVKLASVIHEMQTEGSVTLTNGTGNWYDTYVGYAVENSIVDEEMTEQSREVMDGTITRADFVEIFSKSVDEEDLPEVNKVSDDAIPDVKLGDKNADAIYTFYRAGILVGVDENGTFNPNGAIKRSEVAAIVNRMYNKAARKSITLN